MLTAVDGDMMWRLETVEVRLGFKMEAQSQLHFFFRQPLFQEL